MGWKIGFTTALNFLQTILRAQLHHNAQPGGVALCAKASHSSLGPNDSVGVELERGVNTGISGLVGNSAGRPSILLSLNCCFPSLISLSAAVFSHGRH